MARTRNKASEYSIVIFKLRFLRRFFFVFFFFACSVGWKNKRIHWTPISVSQVITWCGLLGLSLQKERYLLSMNCKWHKNKQCQSKISPSICITIQEIRNLAEELWIIWIFKAFYYLYKGYGELWLDSLFVRV